MATSLHLLVFPELENHEEEDATEIYINSRNNIVVIPGKIGLFEITEDDWIDIKKFIDKEFSKL